MLEAGQQTARQSSVAAQMPKKHGAQPQTRPQKCVPMQQTAVLRSAVAARLRMHASHVAQQQVRRQGLKQPTPATVAMLWSRAALLGLGLRPPRALQPPWLASPTAATAEPRAKRAQPVPCPLTAEQQRPPHRPTARSGQTVPRRTRRQSRARALRKMLTGRSSARLPLSAPKPAAPKPVVCRLQRRRPTTRASAPETHWPRRRWRGLRCSAAQKMPWNRGAPPPQRVPPRKNRHWCATQLAPRMRVAHCGRYCCPNLPRKP